MVGGSALVEIYYSRSRSLQALGLLAGTKPSKVAVGLSLTDWLLVVVLLGTGTSVSSSTVAITDATVINRLKLYLAGRHHHQVCV